MKHSFRLPEEASVVFDSLADHDPENPLTLLDDILYIKLSEDTAIHVGWRPMLDPSGSFIVETVNCEDGLINASQSHENVNDVIQSVQRILDSHNSGELDASNRAPVNP